MIAQNALISPYFRIYNHDDVIGVEMGGAIKNVIAIGAGIRPWHGVWSQHSGGVDNARSFRDVTTRCCIGRP